MTLPLRSPEEHRNWHLRLLEEDETLKARFWAKVHIPTDLEDCWQWTAGKNPAGYGMIGARLPEPDARQTILIASRVAYYYANGTLPPAGQYVLHMCDRPGCVNAAHLFTGTQADNMADKVSKGRQSKGESHGMSKLTRARAALVLWASHFYRHPRRWQSWEHIAGSFGLTSRAVRFIHEGKRWGIDVEGMIL